MRIFGGEQKYVHFAGTIRRSAHYEKRTATFQQAFFTALVKKSGARDELRDYEGHKSVLRYFNPESLIRMATVFPAHGPRSSLRAAARLAPKDKPAKMADSRNSADRFCGYFMTRPLILL